MKKIPAPLTNNSYHTTPSLYLTIFLSLTIPLMVHAAQKPVLVTKNPIFQHAEDKNEMAKIAVYNTSAYPIIIKAICEDPIAGFIDKYAEVLENSDEPDTEKTIAIKEHSKLKTSSTVKTDTHLKDQPSTAIKNARAHSTAKKTDQDSKPIAPMSTGTIYVPHHAKSIYALIQTDFPYVRTDAIDFNVQKEDDAFVFTTYDGTPRLVCEETTQKKSLLFFNQTEIDQTVIFIVDYSISIFSYKAKSHAFTIPAHKALRIPAPTNSSQFSIGTVTISIPKKLTPFVITQPEYSPTVAVTPLESNK